VDNLTPFAAFFQGLNIDLNQSHCLMLKVFKSGDHGKDHVNHMYA